MAKRNARIDGSPSAPTVGPTPEQVAKIEAERTAMNRVEAQRGANELQAVLIQVAELLGAKKGLRAWTVLSTRGAPRSPQRALLGPRRGYPHRDFELLRAQRGGGGYAVRAEVNLASNAGSPGEVIARLAFHRDAAEKAAQAEMMLNNWLGRRPEFAVEAIFTTLGDLLNAAEQV